MPRNALAPAPANALARESDPLQSLLRETAASPQYGELVDYLSARRMMPPIQIKSLRSGSFGKFEQNSPFGRELPQTGVVSISPRAGPSTVVHELTHAADSEIDDQYYRLARKNKFKLSDLERQFMSAYEKLSLSPNTRVGDAARYPRQQLASTLNPEWAQKNRNYRSGRDELAAFGMGSTVASNTFNPAPLHLDPTMATEFSILLDLATRLQKSYPVTDKR